MTKQINIEWKSILPENYNENRNGKFDYPTGMHIEFLVEGKIAKSVYYETKAYVDKHYIPTIPYFNWWDGKHWNRISPEKFYETAKVRPNQIDAKVWNKYIDDIKIGDFVKFKGQRNSRVWKKIIEIKPFTLMCLQYKKPIDEIQYFNGYATETLIWKIKEKANV
jgi:hypothetical protein